MFCNKNYRDKIGDTAPIEIQTNGGFIYIGKKCNIFDRGQGYYNNEAVTNIVGLKDMWERY